MLAVFKVGGSVLEDGASAWLEEAKAWLASQGSLVLVHGGGQKISAALKRLGEPVEFIGGQRVTTPAALETVVAVLRGVVNAELVAALVARGWPALGLSGLDGGLLQGTVANPHLGRVGAVQRVRPEVLLHVLDGGYLPVVAPLAGDGEGGVLNVNGDLAAAAIAQALRADLLVFYTDTGGVRWAVDDPDSIVEQLTDEQVRDWIAVGRAQAGMVPKLEAALTALEGGVAAVQIGAWRRPPYTRIVQAGVAAHPGEGC